MRSPGPKPCSRRFNAAPQIEQRLPAQACKVQAAALSAAGNRFEAAREVLADLAKAESQRHFSAAGIGAAP